MKKVFCSFLVLMCFLLCSCTNHSAEYNREKIKVTEYNLQIENATSKYQKSMDKIEPFNSYLYYDLVDLNGEQSNYSNYSDRYDLNSVVQSLRDTVLENGSRLIYSDGVIVNREDIEMYPMFDEDSCKVYNYIIVQGDKDKTVFISEWDNGELVNYSTSRLG